MSEPTMPEPLEVPRLRDPIPNLFDKFGGAAALKRVVTDYCTRLLATPSTRRCYGNSPMPQIIEHSFALFALVLGKPVDDFDFAPMRLVFAEHQITQHAYEEMVLVMRHVLLAGGMVSRDASIAINVLDIHCEHVFGIPALRQVRSPFSGVDRRKLPRAPKAPSAS